MNKLTLTMTLPAILLALYAPLTLAMGDNSSESKRSEERRVGKECPV